MLVLRVQCMRNSTLVCSDASPASTMYASIAMRNSTLVCSDASPMHRVQAMRRPRYGLYLRSSCMHTAHAMTNTTPPPLQLATGDHGDCGRIMQTGDTKSNGYITWTANRSCAFAPGWRPQPSGHGSNSLPCLAFAVTEKPLAVTLSFAPPASAQANVAHAQV
jgi:hypothetical protein